MMLRIFVGVNMFCVKKCKNEKTGRHDGIRTLGRLCAGLGCARVSRPRTGVRPKVSSVFNVLACLLACLRVLSFDWSVSIAIKAASWLGRKIKRRPSVVLGAGSGDPRTTETRAQRSSWISHFSPASHNINRELSRKLDDWPIVHRVVQSSMSASCTM